MEEDVTCKEIFAEIPKRFNPEGAGDWNAVMQFNIDGPKGGNFTLTIKDGTCAMSEGQGENPTATVTTSDETWIGMTVTKTVKAEMAFMTGKLKVQGNIADVMKMNNPSVFKPE